MKCPFCRFEQTETVNTRPTYHQSQIWRRRKCLSCQAVFTTYELVDTSFIKVIKSTGRKERFSRAKLFSGLYGAYLSIPNKENIVEEATQMVESRLLDLRKKEITSSEIAKVTLSILATHSPTAFARYLAYNTAPQTIAQLKKEINKY